MRKVLLVGAGHSHIEVIRRWSLAKIDEVEVTVVDPNPRPVYSGMVPGYIAGQYAQEDLEIDLASLCERGGVERIEEAAIAIDATNNTLTCSDVGSIPYDVASIDIGSSVAGMGLPGVNEFALPSRPISRFLKEIDELARASEPRAADPIVVVGGGAGGVEVAFCLDTRLATGGASGQVAIVTSTDSLLEGSAASARRAVERQAARRSIPVHRARKVRAVRASQLEFEDGETLEARGIVWVTGPAAIPAASGFDLPKDDRGFFEIDSSFRVRGTQNLFAVGDCASLPGMKKAGVYAVRAGPVIDANLRAWIAGESLQDYSPQSDFLSLLNLGDGTAVATKWGMSLRGKAMMRLKDRIDRGFMEKYGER